MADGPRRAHGTGYRALNIRGGRNTPEPVPHLRKAVFLDRDGTLNVDLQYIADPGLIEVYRGVIEGLRQLAAAQFLLVVVSNQSGISRGLYTPDIVDRIHARIQEILSTGGVHIDAFYYCPHAPGEGCPCRKPGTALLTRAAAEMNIDLAGSAIIGNSRIDMEAGRRLGLMTVLVRSRHFRISPEDGQDSADADHVATNFLDACQKILPGSGVHAA